jgi:hypothetical protein
MLGLVVGTAAGRADALVEAIVCYRVDTSGKMLKV